MKNTFNSSLSLLILIVSFFTFYSSLSNGFALDDHILILDNPGIFSFERALNYFTHAVFPGDLYRPITMLSYAANYVLDGLNPFGFHLFNVFLHAFNSILVFQLLSKLFHQRLGLGTALIFAVLPIHTEAVANVVGRAELLSSFFVLSSLIIFVKALDSHAVKAYTLSGLFLLFGLLSKESAICTILLYGLILYYRQIKFRSLKYPSIIFSIIVFLWIVARSIALAAFFKGASQTAFIDNPLFELGLLARLLPAISLLGKYFCLSLLPLELSADYSYPALLPFSFEFYQSIAWLVVAFAALAATFYGIRKKHLTGFFLAWFFLSFVVTANILIPIGTIFGERLAYLPSLGAAGLLAWLLLQVKQPILSLLASLAICFSYAFSSYSWAAVWKNNETLHTAQIELMPLSAKTQLNYAMLMLEAERYEESELHARKALELYPEYAHAAWAIAEINLRRGAYTTADEWFRKAYMIDPSHADSLFGLGRLALALGDLTTAEVYFNKTIEVKPSSFEAELGKLAILVNRKEWEKAKDKIAKLSEWNPNHSELKKIIAVMDREIGQE
ncbi:MAG: tetratricopeptide repeat protein [Bdellovibrionota bacterium]